MVHLLSRVPRATVATKATLVLSTVTMVRSKVASKVVMAHKVAMAMDRSTAIMAAKAVMVIRAITALLSMVVVVRIKVAIAVKATMVPDHLHKVVTGLRHKAAVAMDHLLREAMVAKAVWAVTDHQAWVAKVAIIMATKAAWKATV